ncbi:MAG: class I SAM-dependent methyltransferase [Usitatibacter sp.]
MAEIRSGVRHLLARPRIYDWFQHAVGAYAWRRNFVRDFVEPVLREGSRVIDIGCGTGDILRFLPRGVSYAGFDRNEAYIAAARERFAGRGASFECREVGPGRGAQSGDFDVALAIGLMHHLDDDEAFALLRSAKGALRDGGVLFLLDPVLVPEQSRLARYVVRKDRGQNVRTLEATLELCGRVFPFVRHSVDLHPIRIPYTGVIVTCSSRAPPGARTGAR